MSKPFYPPTMSRQSTGSLIVELTSDPVLGPIQPISDALVQVKRIAPTGEEELLVELTTNEVGQTTSIELETPALELSLDPTNTTDLPYSTYKIETFNENYVDALIIGSQVFADTESIQPIRLTPTRSTPFSTPTRSLNRQQLNTIIIGPARLFGDYPPKIPEPEIVIFPPGSGFITLDSVIIPEFIVVHAGLPTDMNAPNYTVPYVDYIKNVACSEIYPTWPVQTIEANAIAIISFTLNRVFTEWYRNQGKPFTITNSTAFDHAFFYGRNVFNSVSPVVDRVFDTYIKRPAVIQPLLAQYCDGVQTQCPNWMTQWGSKDLGDKGLNAEEILKYFYGENLEVETAPKVQGIPESYPGQPLKLGDSSSDVRKIQEQLNRISNNYPLIPKVAVSGDFDKNTENAVKTFQKIFHLPQDGIVGKDTWYKISQIYVAVTKIAELI